MVACLWFVLVATVAEPGLVLVVVPVVVVVAVVVAEKVMAVVAVVVVVISAAVVVVEGQAYLCAVMLGMVSPSVILAVRA
jgi:hypothetical protein